MSTDYDSPWREALDAYFEAFLAGERRPLQICFERRSLGRLLQLIELINQSNI